ncbi:glycosyltransferase family 4 protein [candidate division WOR-3 bacterium]|nr:glycosyltransferase family 4 protein [candidate division WOR-3 bacterium]
MKTIGILHFSCPPVIGGVEAVIEAHTDLLLQHGFKVKVIIGKGNKSRKDIEFEKIPELNALHPECQKIRNELETGIVSDSFSKLKDKIKEQLKIALKDIDILIIHNILSVHFNLPLVLALHEIIPSLNIKVISWCHDITLLDPNYATGNPKTFPWSLLATPIPNVTYVAISSLRQKELSNVLQILKDSIHVIPDGIDEHSFLSLSQPSTSILNKYKLQNADIVMLFPSRIIKRKNFELGIKVTAELLKLKKSAYFIITGPPDPHNIISIKYYQELKELANKLNVKNRIIFLYDIGIKVTYKMLRELYSISDILFLSSTREGFGIPLLEAGLMKIPIFCPEISPLTELGQNDVNYFNDNPKDIAQTIVKITSQSKTSKIFRKILKNYTWHSLFKHKILPLLKE